MKKRLKINAIIIILAVLLMAMFPDVFFRKIQASFLEIISVGAGFIFILLGQVIRVSARGFKAEHSGQGRELIQGGPYACVRNPMYLGILSIGLGVVLVLFKWWVVAIFLAAFTLRYILLIFQEEKKLLQLFPAEYPSYCKSVPRLLPSLKNLAGLKIKQCLPLKSIWFKKEIGAIAAVLSAVILLKLWQVIRAF